MKPFLLFASLSVIFLLSCNKDDDSPNTKLSESYFPNEVGNQWTYYRYDSLNQLQDTMHVTITGETTHYNGEQLKIWHYESRFIDALKYVFSSDDTIKIYSFTGSTIVDQIYVVPFEINASWTNPDYLLYNTKVENLEDLNTELEDFQDVYKLVRHHAAFNDYHTQQLWIKPYIGLVQLYDLHYVLGPLANENWYLIDYTVN